MPNRERKINFSKELKAEWAKSAYSLLVANKALPKTIIPSESWINSYLNSFHTKVSVFYRGVAVNEGNFFEGESRTAILGTLEADIEVNKKHSRFIPLTAQALKSAYVKGFSIGG